MKKLQVLENEVEEYYGREPYFELLGNFDTHYGIFPDCGTPLPYQEEAGPANDSAMQSGCC